ncbi:MAG: hypothetical protein JOZ38_08045 [Candidatus Eremiobacteraeota bacterium]|nr:hypothetical protein [Candidatus Eremiobacteraeota bacterium]
MIRRSLIAAIALLAAAAPAQAKTAASHPSPPPSDYGTLKYREVGPAISGGRVAAAAGSDRNPFLYYVGSAGGGVFKTTNAGFSFHPVFTKPVGSIGAVTIAPGNDDVVWVGTGEANPRNDVSYGNGVYLSTDGGKTFVHRGLDATSQIARILVDPRNSNVAIVAALGDPFRDSTERGIYRTADGGKTWKRALYFGPQSGGSDLAWDPLHPDVMYAGIWQFRRLPWRADSGGPNDGLFKSTDNGKTWTQLRGHGLPAGLMGRIGLAVSRGNPNDVWALIQSKSGLLWHSTDGGATWKFVTSDTAVDQRPFYFSHIYVDPSKPSHVLALSMFMAESLNRGKTFKKIQQGQHPDFHTLWWSADGKRLLSGMDGGILFSTDNAKHWTWIGTLPIGQAYHIGYDTDVPYHICLPLQDNSSWCGTSNDPNTIGILERDWEAMSGGDGVWVWPDPLDSKLIWNDTQGGSLSIFDERSQESVDISPSEADQNMAPLATFKHRFNWLSPIAFSPQDGHTAYFGGEVVFKTVDRGRHWTVISPDLTRNVKAHQQYSGGPIGYDNSSAEYSDTILEIAPSPVKAGVLWVGTDDGLVQYTDDEGAHWHNVTPGGIAPFGAVETIEPGRFDAATAFATIDRHKMGDRAPYVFVTTNAGASWQSITNGLPRDQQVRVVRQSLHDPNVLFAGLENSLYVSYDRGAHWKSLQLDLPSVAVHDLRIQPAANDLLVATHGRNAFILDDLAAVEQLQTAKRAGAYLFPLRDAYQFNQWPQVEEPYGYVGDNPDFGALVSFYQSAPSKNAPTAEVLASDGSTIRHIAGSHFVQGEATPYITNETGVNRFAWSLSADAPVKWHSAPRWNQGPDDGPSVVPGTYRVRVHVRGQTLERDVVVKADPRQTWTQADYEARFAYLREQYDEFSHVDVALNAIDAYIKAHGTHGPNSATLLQLRRALSSDPRNEEDSIAHADGLRERLQGLMFGIGGSFQPPFPAHLEEAAAAKATYTALMAQYDRLMK